MNIFEEVKKQLEFIDIAEKAEKKENHFYCGIHGDKETPDLKVYSDGNWKCFSCGARGGDLKRLFPGWKTLKKNGERKKRR